MDFGQKEDTQAVESCHVEESSAAAADAAAADGVVVVEGVDQSESLTELETAAPVQTNDIVSNAILNTLNV
jgi:hypothetical protein